MVDELSRLEEARKPTRCHGRGLFELCPWTAGLVQQEGAPYLPLTVNEEGRLGQGFVATIRAF